MTLMNAQEDGLMVYYPFNGNANDESGNGNHGEVNGAMIDEEGVPGIINQSNLTATSFDGVVNWVSFDINGNEQQRSFG